MRSLEITRADNIERAWMRDHSVQLKNVGAQAVLCTHSENRALEHDPLSGDYIDQRASWRRFRMVTSPCASPQPDYPAQQLASPGWSRTSSPQVL